MRAAAVILLALVLVPAAGAGGTPPPGATARCVDGTYSFSQHRSGTCSHHHGVAAWLGAAATAAPHSPSTSLRLGATVLLAPRARSSRCRLGALPDRACSPGAYYARLTKAAICAPGFRTGSIRDVSEATKHLIESAYGLVPRSYGSSLEIDHIVPLELGGSNSPANLFPERGYHPKDRLENRLHALVCSGAIPLRSAQRQIAANWQALYRRVFGT